MALQFPPMSSFSLFLSSSTFALLLLLLLPLLLTDDDGFNLGHKNFLSSITAIPINISSSSSLTKFSIKNTPSKTSLIFLSLANAIVCFSYSSSLGIAHTHSSTNATVNSGSYVPLLFTNSINSSLVTERLVHKSLKSSSSSSSFCNDDDDEHFFLST